MRFERHTGRETTNRICCYYSFYDAMILGLAAQTSLPLKEDRKVSEMRSSWWCTVNWIWLTLRPIYQPGLQNIRYSKSQTAMCHAASAGAQFPSGFLRKKSFDRTDEVLFEYCIVKFRKIHGYFSRLRISILFLREGHCPIGLVNVIQNFRAVLCGCPGYNR